MGGPGNQDPAVLCSIFGLPVFQCNSKLLPAKSLMVLPYTVQACGLSLQALSGNVTPKF